jgi:hypothetical protein
MKMAVLGQSGPVITAWTRLPLSPIDIESRLCCELASSGSSSMDKLGRVPAAASPTNWLRGRKLADWGPKMHSAKIGRFDQM